MDQKSPNHRGLFYDDFKIGQQIVTVSRTITEADIVNFAGLSGDYNQMHVDSEYSKTTDFGARVAHGLLGLSIISGLAVQTGVLEGTVLGFREIDQWKFIKPIYIQDTIHGVLEVIDKKSLPRLGGGKVVIKISVINQHGDVVMRGNWQVLVKAEESK